MSELTDILSYNQRFVESGEYEKYFTDKYPGREPAILSCMDARIIELLPNALGLKNGDAKLIKKRRCAGDPSLGFGDAQFVGGRI